MKKFSYSGICADPKCLEEHTWVYNRCSRCNFGTAKRREDMLEKYDEKIIFEECSKEKIPAKVAEGGE